MTATVMHPLHQVAVMRDFGTGDISGDNDVWSPPLVGYRFEANQHAFQRRHWSAHWYYANHTLRVAGRWRTSAEAH